MLSSLSSSQDLRVTKTCPAEWDTLAAATADFAVSRRWLETMGPLLPGQLHWLTAGASGARVGLQLRHLMVPPAESRFDIEAVLRGDIPTPDPCVHTLPRDHTGPLYPTMLAMLPGYACVPAGGGAMNENLMTQVVHAVDRWARGRGARSVAFLYIAERQHVLHQALRNFGAQSVNLHPICVMPINFATLEEYMEQLTSKRRLDLRRLLRRTEQSGLTLGESDLQDSRDQVLELRLGALRKHGHHADRITQAAALDRIIRFYPPEDRVLATVRDGDRIVAFTLALRHDSTLRVLWFGQYPEGSYGAWFVTMFYLVVAAALRRSIARIVYGTMNWREKASFGCLLEPLSGYTWRL